MASVWSISVATSSAVRPLLVFAFISAPALINTGDGIKNEDDADADGNGSVDAGKTDTDGDGIADAADADANGDGTVDDGKTDTDGDGIADQADDDQNMSL